MDLTAAQRSALSRANSALRERGETRYATELISAFAADIAGYDRKQDTKAAPDAVDFPQGSRASGSVDTIAVPLKDADDGA